MDIKHILECVKRTNPQMTEKKLLAELSKCRYSTAVLCMVCENDKRLSCNE